MCSTEASHTGLEQHDQMSIFWVNECFNHYQKTWTQSEVSHCVWSWNVSTWRAVNVPVTSKASSVFAQGIDSGPQFYARQLPEGEFQKKSPCFITHNTQSNWNTTLHHLLASNLQKCMVKHLNVIKKASYLEVAGVNPEVAIPSTILIQRSLVTSLVMKLVSICDVVNELRTHLQPAGHILL